MPTNADLPIVCTTLLKLDIVPTASKPLALRRIIASVAVMPPVLTPSVNATPDLVNSFNSCPKPTKLSTNIPPYSIAPATSV